MSPLIIVSDAFLKMPPAANVCSMEGAAQEARHG